MKEIIRNRVFTLCAIQCVILAVLIVLFEIGTDAALIAAVYPIIAEAMLFPIGVYYWFNYRQNLRIGTVVRNTEDRAVTLQ